MKLIGFNFNKINVVKNSNVVDKLEISTNINIKEIKQIKSDILKSKEDLLDVVFNYSVSYAPNFATIEIEGNMILSVDSKLTRNILKNWKNKEMAEEFKFPLFNLILKKASIKALELEDDCSLPLHLPMPAIRKQEKGQNTK